MATRRTGPYSSGFHVDRREFVRTVGGAGLLGAFASVSPSAQAGGQGATSRPAPDEFPKPPGLRPGAQLDSRFPVSFATSVSEGLRLVTEYFVALNQRNIEGIARTLHFPFAIYEDIEPIVIQSAADFIANPPPTLNATGKGKTQIL